MHGKEGALKFGKKLTIFVCKGGKYFAETGYFT